MGADFGGGLIDVELMTDLDELPQPQVTSRAIVTRLLTLQDRSWRTSCRKVFAHWRMQEGRRRPEAEGRRCAARRPRVPRRVRPPDRGPVAKQTMRHCSASCMRAGTRESSR